MGGGWGGERVYGGTLGQAWSSTATTTTTTGDATWNWFIASGCSDVYIFAVVSFVDTLHSTPTHATFVRENATATTRLPQRHEVVTFIHIDFITFRLKGRRVWARHVCTRLHRKALGAHSRAHFCPLATQYPVRHGEARRSVRSGPVPGFMSGMKHCRSGRSHRERKRRFASFVCVTLVH